MDFAIAFMLACLAASFVIGAIGLTLLVRGVIRPQTGTEGEP